MSELFAPSDRIPPVWNRIPAFFAYPFKGAVLTVLVAFSLLYALSILPGLLGFMFWLLAWLGIYKYAYEVLAHTAEGNLEPPEGQHITSSDYMAFKHVGLLVVMLAVTLLVALRTGSALAMLFTGLFFALAWPAAIITLAMTGSFIAALNPVTWVSVIGRVGWAYLAASVFILLMQWSEQFVTAVFADAAGNVGIALYVGGFFISSYFLLASFHLMGYLVYQHHEALGVEVDEPLGPAPAASEDERILAESQSLIRDGEVESAVELLGSRIRSAGGTPELHDQYRKLLRLQEREAELLEHDRDYIARLLRGFEQPKKAIQIARECLQLDQDFRPADADQAVVLAQLGEQYGAPEVCIACGTLVANEHPGHRDAPRAVLPAAKALSDRYGEDERALDMLRTVRERHPEHPLGSEMDDFMATLKRLMSMQKPVSGS